MRKSKRLLAFTLAALQILMLLPSTGMSAYAEEPEAVSESVESDEPSGVLPSDPVEGTEDSLEPVEDAGATLEPSGVPSVDPVEGTEDSLEPVEDAGAIENKGQAGVLPAESTESTGDPAKSVESTEPSEVLPSDPVEDAGVIENEGQAGVLPSDEPDVFYTLKVVDTYADTQVSDVRYEESLPAGQGYSFSALEADGYVVGGDAEYQGELTEDTTLEFVYDREYTVTFYDMIMEEVITKVKVKSGEAAEAPEAPVYEGFEFIGWSEEFNSVSSDLTIETLYQASGVSLMSAGTELSNDYASAILYEDEKRLVVTGMFKSGSGASVYPWYSKVSGYSVEFTDDVTSIGAWAFYGSGIAGELVIPDTVISIGNNAFLGCSGLTGDLVIPDSVTSIGRSAFGNCSGFEGSLILSASIRSIADYAFQNCSGLTDIVASNDLMCSGPDNAFSGCTSLTCKLLCNLNGLALLYNNEKKLVVQRVSPDGSYPWINVIKGCTVEFTNNVTCIGNKAFSGTGIVGNLIIPDTVTTIGDYAFNGCTGLTGGLIIPDTVTTIGDYAFNGCSGMTGDLAIPDLVTSIGNYAFQNCSGFGGTLTLGTSVATIGNYAFSNCTGFTGELVILNSVTSIGDYAFYSCAGLVGDLTIPDSVTSIGIYAFSACTGFTGNLVISDSVTSIGDYAFWRCTGFTGDLVIPASVTSIGQSVFFDCSGFNGSLVLNNVETIGNWAFKNCTGLTGNLVLPDTLVSIGDSAFEGCKSLEGDLVIPDKITSIGSSSFKDCSGFSGLALNDSLEIIEDYAFENCSGMTGDLKIPDSVISIGQAAFRGCSGFTGNLIISDSVESIKESAFYGCSGFSDTLVFGKSLGFIGMYAFNKCTGIKVIRDNSEVSSLVLEKHDKYPSYIFSVSPDKVETILITDKDVLLKYAWSRDGRTLVNPGITFSSKGGTSVVPQSVAYGEYAEKPKDPTKAGYKFLGWSLNYTSDEYFDFETTPITDRITLYAQWEEIKFYGIVFSTNGGTSVAPVSVKEGEYAARPEDPTKEGYKFLGWKISDDAEEYFDFESTQITQDITLYAQWEVKDTITVTFDSQGGTPVASLELKKIYDDGDTEHLNGYAYISEPEIPTKEGCEFRFWSHYGSKFDFESPVTSDITLYAEWVDLTITVTFDTQGGTPIESLKLKKVYDEWDTEHSYGYAYIPEPEAPTKEGCEFKYWSYYGYKFDFGSSVTSDTTLYAIWIDPSKKATVTFDSQGGTPVAPQEVVVNTNAVAPEAPTREGYEFKYWSKYNWDYKPEFYFASEIITSDITLYAVWFDPNETFTVTFDSDGGTPVDSQEVLVNTNAVEPEVPTKEGYIFGFWRLDLFSDYPFVFENEIITRDITLYARWYAPSEICTVTFETYGGTLIDSQKVIQGRCVTEPKPPEREGYNFAGWFTDESFTYYYNFWDAVYDFVKIS